MVDYPIKTLDEFLQLPPAMRRMRLRQPGMRDLLSAMGTEAGIAWLEAHIESPVGSEWGIALLHLNPRWLHLDRWIRKSKLHCLAAMEALFRCTDPWGDGEKRRLPEGADAMSINDAVDFALAHYGNPRLKKAAKDIRHAWPRGKRKQHTVNVPTPLDEAAELVLCNDSSLVNNWHEQMAMAMDAPDTPFRIWDSLLSYAASKNCLVMVDWKEYPENVVVSLRDLKPTEGFSIEWNAFNDFEGDNDNLLHAIATKIASQGYMLVSLDHGCDDYPLTFLPSECVPRLMTSLDSLGDEAIRIMPFGTRGA